MKKNVAIKPKNVSPRQLRDAKRHPLDLRYKVLEYFLFHGLTHRELQKEVLQMPAPKHGGGFEAMYILHYYGLGGNDTRGILANVKTYEELKELFDSRLFHFSVEQLDAVKEVWRRHSNDLKPDLAKTQRVVEKKETNKNIEWTDFELRETVKAYLYMLDCEAKGESYNKSEVNKSLRNGLLSKRTRGSIEYRMENISATLAELCLPWIQGYKPHGNVGSKVKTRIINMLDELGAIESTAYTPTDNTSILDQRSHELMKKKLIGKPSGNMSPSKKETVSEQYVRDPLVKAWVLKNAKGFCELCDQLAPFHKGDGTPYLETHHVKALSDSGNDTINNVVALCPNCHKRCHFSSDKEKVDEQLYQKIERLTKTG